MTADAEPAHRALRRVVRAEVHARRYATEEQKHASVNEGEGCHAKKRSLLRINKKLVQLYVAFTVRRARGSFPPLKILKGSKGLRHNCIFRRKIPNAMDAGRTRGYLIARNAKCSLAQLNEASTFAANVKNIPAMT